MSFLLRSHGTPYLVSTIEDAIASFIGDMADLPSPPFVDVPGIANFRDIGGNGIRRGSVFRSADPSKATEEGLTKMGRELGKVCLIFAEDVIAG